MLTCIIWVCILHISLTIVRWTHSSIRSGIVPRGKNPPSRQFGSGQRQPHIGAPRSQSGTQSFGIKPKPKRGNSSSGSIAGALGAALFGPGPKSKSHGGSKKGRNKGKGSR